MKKKTWLEERTGKSFFYWSNRIGILISKHAYKGKDPIHSEVDIEDWMGDLSKELEKRMGPSGRYDGNMRYASALGMILTGWFVRLIRAKCYDPRRPVKIRRQMMNRRTAYLQELMKLIVDESQDPKMFPKQKWDVPHSKEAKNGSYV